MGFVSGFWSLVSEWGVNTGKGLSGALRARFHFLRHAACLFWRARLFLLMHKQDGNKMKTLQI